MRMPLNEVFTHQQVVKGKTIIKTYRGGDELPEGVVPPKAVPASIHNAKEKKAEAPEPKKKEKTKTDTKSESEEK